MTAQKFYVRPATSKDKDHTPHVTKFINDAYNSTETWTSTIEFVDGDRITTQGLDAIIDHHEGPKTLLYAFDNDKVIGVILVSPIEQFPGEALLSMLAVSPEYQSQGVGGLLIKEGIEYTQSIGLKTPVVHVFKGRPELLKWYGHLGFKEEETIDFFFPEILKIKGDGTRTVIMKR
ncbi:acyl-CoA N-acyltransferase [Backusella circina FSU 941]|nr:acyl-CoA N-acyltransferase [Backusella circina FSU 941]